MLQLKIFGAPYGRDGESLGEAVDEAVALGIAESNLQRGQRVEARDEAGELITAFEMVDDAVQEIAV